MSSGEMFATGGGVGEKKYNMQFNVGGAKYVINYHANKSVKNIVQFFSDKIKEVESDLYREYNKKEIGGSIDGIKALKQKIKDYSNFKKEKRTYEQEDEKMYKNREKEIEKKQFNDYLENLYGVEAKNGGLMGLKMGGTPIEMDYRMGGFIPVGAKERADDVPARLSKNEFVMTADAVRAAGGGSVNKGAQRMYNLMNQLEGRLA
jgi:hypothetical protein